ncbi:MAG: pyridoxal phosphate-dependent aminotransferase [Nanobdellota archaeon]
MSERTQKIEASIIREIFSKAATKENLINLSIGQPDFPVPEQIKESIKDAIDSDKTRYTPSSGISDLKEEIRKKYSGNNEVLITPGASAGLFLSFSSLFDKEDEVIIIDPYFVAYPNLLKFLDLKPVYAKTAKDYSLDIDEINSKITTKTKGIIINTPNNPTGAVYTKEQLQSLAEIAEKYNLYLISDEVYSQFDYSGNFKTLGNIYSKAIVINGYSKKYAMTGLRMGYVYAPEEIINEMTKLQQFTFVCAPSICQESLVEKTDIFMLQETEDLRRKRDYIYKELKEHYDIVKPDGAFYFYIRLNNMKGKDFCEKCLENNLLTVPGIAFSQEDNAFRISYAVDFEILEKGVETLKKLAGKQAHAIK